MVARSGYGQPLPNDDQDPAVLRRNAMGTDTAVAARLAATYDAGHPDRPAAQARAQTRPRSRPTSPPASPPKTAQPNGSGSPPPSTDSERSDGQGTGEASADPTHLVEPHHPKPITPKK